jgi:hypothetical protein
MPTCLLEETKGRDDIERITSYFLLFSSEFKVNSIQKNINFIFLVSLISFTLVEHLIWALVKDVIYLIAKKTQLGVRVI